MKRIAINGLGRIGRLVFRLLYDHPEIEIVAINDLAHNDILAHLIKYDTAHGRWNHQISHDEHHIIVNGKPIFCTEIADWTQLPWKEKEIDLVIECSGIAKSGEKAAEHLKAGAKKVIISQPADEKTKTIVMGINDDSISTNDVVLSNASCTTNCLAPMIKVLEDNFGIESAFMSTVHSYTADQKLQDAYHKSDFRRARAAAENIVPTTTHATRAVEIVIPEVKGKMTGGAMRVPVLDGSLTELYCNLSHPANKKEMNRVFKDAAEKGRLKGILEYTEDPIVSSDIVGNPYSCIFDSLLTDFVTDRFCKIVGWYDNEFGYSNRLAELVIKVAKL